MAGMNPRRRRMLRDGRPGDGPVVYWMSRDQRLEDNWALLQAQEIALEQGRPLSIVFCLVDQYAGAGWRQFGFMLSGLAEVARSCAELNIDFRLLRGEPGQTLPSYLQAIQAGWLVTDFDPLRIKARWKQELVSQVDLPISEVDAHNVVPCWVASDKREFAARTIRPKLQRALTEFFEPYPEMTRHPYGRAESAPPDWHGLRAELDLSSVAAEVTRPKPGPAAGRAALERFIEQRLPRYAKQRNDPNAEAVSGLSPYFHFGQLSPQRALLEVSAASGHKLAEARETFIEEALVRRELSDNYCFYTPNYDAWAGLPDWARQTLEAHRHDPREYVYSQDTLEQGMTHDRLWNAAQMEMVRTGTMHGYLRMYWAKKILEWTASPEEALDLAIRLNDRYQLDGRDPNGYTGVMWSIGGLHDRPFAERRVFGKIRFMSYAGCRRKFDVEAYIHRFQAGRGEEA